MLLGVFMARWLLFIPLILFIGLGIFLYQGLSIDPTALPSALINKPFPDFKVENLKQPNTFLTKADFGGKPVLINVWATWCPSCREEHQQLLNIAAEHKIKIIGLNYKDERDLALQWLQTLGDPYQFVIYDKAGMLGLDLGVYGAPETYLVDAQGIIKYRHVGVVTAQDWQKLQEMLNEKSHS
jgi:cytochrome c biogenesis protein CcmG, thiol:disulfide interchange protein DsbE